MPIRKNDIIKIRKNDYQIRVNPDGNPHHEARVNSYSIGIGHHNIGGKGSYINYTTEMTLDDLKELRKVIRKFVKDESHKSV